VLGCGWAIAAMSQNAQTDRNQNATSESKCNFVMINLQCQFYNKKFIAQPKRMKRSRKARVNG
jgi:hypothetical protein